MNSVFDLKSQNEHLIKTTSTSHKNKELIDEDLICEKIKNIDHDIKKLNDIQRGYKAKVLYHQDQAIRIQFQKDQLLLAKQHGKLANGYQQIVDHLDQQIRELEQRKKELLQQLENSSIQNC